LSSITPLAPAASYGESSGPAGGPGGPGGPGGASGGAGSTSYASTAPQAPGASGVGAGVIAGGAAAAAAGSSSTTQETEVEIFTPQPSEAPSNGGFYGPASVYGPSSSAPNGGLPSTGGNNYGPALAAAAGLGAVGAGAAYAASQSGFGKPEKPLKPFIGTEFEGANGSPVAGGSPGDAGAGIVAGGAGGYGPSTNATTTTTTTTTTSSSSHIAGGSTGGPTTHTPGSSTNAGVGLGLAAGAVAAGAGAAYVASQSSSNSSSESKPEKPLKPLVGANVDVSNGNSTTTSSSTTLFTEEELHAIGVSSGGPSTPSSSSNVPGGATSGSTSSFADQSGSWAGAALAGAAVLGAGAAVAVASSSNEHKPQQSSSTTTTTTTTTASTTTSTSASNVGHSGTYGPSGQGSTGSNVAGGVGTGGSTESTTVSSETSSTVAQTGSSQSHSSNNTGISVGGAAAVAVGAAVAGAAIAGSHEHSSSTTSETESNVTTGVTGGQTTTTTISSSELQAGNVAPSTAVGVGAAGSSDASSTIVSGSSVGATATTTTTTTTTTSTSSSSWGIGGIAAGIGAAAAGVAVGVAGAIYKKKKTDLEIVELFLHEIETTYHAIFHIRLFEIKCLLIKAGFDVETFLKLVIKTVQLKSEADLEDLFKGSGLDVLVSKRTEVLSELVGAQCDNVYGVLEELRVTLSHVSSVEAFIGALYVLYATKYKETYSLTTTSSTTTVTTSKIIKLRKDQIITILKIYLTRIQTISTTSKLDIASFTSKIKVQQPSFDASVSLIPRIEANTIYPYSSVLLSEDLKGCGVSNVSSTRIFKEYVYTLTGYTSGAEAEKTLELWGKLVKLLGAELFAGHIYTVLGQSTTSTVDSVTVTTQFLKKIQKLKKVKTESTVVLLDVDAFEAEGKKMESGFSAKVFFERLLIASNTSDGSVTGSASSTTSTTIITSSTAISNADSNSISAGKISSTTTSTTTASDAKFTPAKIAGVLTASRIPAEHCAPNTKTYQTLLETLTGFPSSTSSSHEVSQTSAETIINILDKTLQTVGVEAFLSALSLARERAEFDQRPASIAESFDSTNKLTLERPLNATDVSEEHQQKSEIEASSTSTVFVSEIVKVSETEVTAVEGSGVIASEVSDVNVGSAVATESQSVKIEKTQTEEVVHTSVTASTGR
jgi:hypothetical protein